MGIDRANPSFDSRTDSLIDRSEISIAGGRERVAVSTACTLFSAICLNGNDMVLLWTTLKSFFSFNSHPLLLVHTCVIVVCTRVTHADVMAVMERTTVYTAHMPSYTVHAKWGLATYNVCYRGRDFINHTSYISHVRIVSINSKVTREMHENAGVMIIFAPRSFSKI